MIPRIRAAADRWGARVVWIERTVYHTARWPVSHLRYFPPETPVGSQVVEQ